MILGQRKALRLGFAALIVSVALFAGSAAVLQWWPTASQRQSTRISPPASVIAKAGRGYIALAWAPVSGAVFYRVFRAKAQNAEWAPMSAARGRTPRLVERIFAFLLPGIPLYSFGNTDFLDPSVQPNHTYWYRVSAYDGSLFSPPSMAVSCAPLSSGSNQITVRVDATKQVAPLNHKWEVMVNSEHLSYMLKGDINQHLTAAGAELRRANKRLHDDFGIRFVRAHGILMDDLGVYKENANGQPVYDWTGVDRVYDMVLQDGLRPLVELDFMPAALAANPKESVFSYHAITSPPKSYAKWGA